MYNESVSEIKERNKTIFTPLHQLTEKDLKSHSSEQLMKLAKDTELRLSRVGEYRFDSEKKKVVILNNKQKMQ